MKASPDYMRERYFLVPVYLFSLGLRAVDVSVFLFLRCCKSQPKTTGKPSVEMITQAIRKNERVVKESLQLLKGKNLLRNEHTICFEMESASPWNRYFFLPRQLFSMGLESTEIAIYAYLMYRENRHTYQCWPSYKKIAKELSIKSTNTVRKYVYRLVEKGLIEIEHTVIRRRDGTTRNGNLMYTILPIENAVACYQKRQLEELELAAKTQSVKQKARELMEAQPETTLQLSFVEDL
ncbi:MAG: helix-turn-helix domain-containing protein [Clostridium sp.]|nr:helix-turn-helix domain-containing protein [Clostridium sp.]